MENAISIAFETGSKLVGFFFCGSVASSGRPSSAQSENLVIMRFTFFATDAMSSNCGWWALAMSKYEVLCGLGPFHGGDPFLVAW